MKGWPKPICRTVLAVLLMVAWVGGAEAAGEDCRTLLQKKCSTCHFVKYICPKMDKNSGAIYWKWIMHSMVKEGMTVTPQESELLVTCLSSRDAQARSFCPEKK